MNNNTRRNPVARNLRKFNRAVVYKDRKKQVKDKKKVIKEQME